MLGFSFLFAGVVLAYVRKEKPSNLIAWNLTDTEQTEIPAEDTLEYHIHQDGVDDIDDGSDVVAINRAVQALENNRFSRIKFTRGPDMTDDPETDAGNDGEPDHPDTFDIYWLEDSRKDADWGDIGTALGVGWTSWNSSGEIIRADVALNGYDVTWRTDPDADFTGSDGPYEDVESVALHEVMHALGVAHTPANNAALTPAENGFHPHAGRTMALDDRIFLREAYPTASYSDRTGAITGSLTVGSTTTSGAVIGAYDAEGVFQAAVLTDESGEYRIPGLPAGTYTIYAQALGTSLGIGRSDFPSYYENGSDMIKSTSSDDLTVSVSEGTVNMNNSLTVTEGDPNLSIDGMVKSSEGGVFTAGSVVLYPPGARDVWIGVTGSGSNWPTSSSQLSSFEITGDGIARLTQPEFGKFFENDIVMKIDVEPGAAPGPRNVIIKNNSGERIMAHGGLTLSSEQQVMLGLGTDGDGFGETRQDRARKLKHQSWPQTSWSAYRDTNGELLPASGDVDGDGFDELVLGFAAPEGEGWMEILDDRRSDFEHLAWLRVKWPSYNNSSNNGTRPACGDVDGDGRDEILVGLDSGGGGWIQVFDDGFTGYEHLKWLNVDWKTYNNNDGKTLPAAGDVDGDGIDEVVIGLGEGADGWFRIMDDGKNGFNSVGWERLNFNSYNTASGKGETRPATGDVDADGADELILGIQSYTTSGGWMEVIEDANHDFQHMKWVRVSWSGYNSSDGQTRPASGDIDLDGHDEIVSGLGSPADGWFQVFDGQAGEFSSLTWKKIQWSNYNSQNGETRPTIGRFERSLY